MRNQKDPVTEKGILNKYKKFISNDEREPIVMFGIEAPKGWLPVIKEMFETIDFYSEAENLEIEVHQIKEKFGEIRFYYSISTPEGMDEDIKELVIDKFRDNMDALENKANHTCGKCSKEIPSERIKMGNYISPYCKECVEEINNYHKGVNNG